VEREIFLPVLIYADKSPELAKVRLNWGTPETPELVPADLIHAAQLQLVHPAEFRKNAVKFVGNSGSQKQRQKALESVIKHLEDYSVPFLHFLTVSKKKATVHPKISAVAKK
jgi:hypothetical protein